MELGAAPQGSAEPAAQRRIKVAMKGWLREVPVVKEFTFQGEEWAVTESQGHDDGYVVTHIATGLRAGGGGDSVHDAMLDFKETIKKAGPEKLARGLARAYKEREYLENIPKYRASAIAKL